MSVHFMSLTDEWKTPSSVYNKLNDKENALKAFKCQLKLAWFLNHCLGEMSAYENISLCYFYLGKLEKSQYYSDRQINGKVEACFSPTK